MNSQNEQYVPISIMKNTQLYVQQQIAKKLQDQIDELLVTAELLDYKCSGTLVAHLKYIKYYLLYVGPTITIEFELNKMDQIRKIEVLSLEGEKYFIKKGTNYEYFPELIALAKSTILNSLWKERPSCFRLNFLIALLLV